VASRDLNLILAALFELRLTCIENERTWTAIGTLAAVLGGERSAMFFGAPAPDRGSDDRVVLSGLDGLLRDARTTSVVVSGMDLSDDERDLILAGLFELTITYLDDADKIERCTALADRLGGDQEALFFGARL